MQRQKEKAEGSEFGDWNICMDDWNPRLLSSW